MQQMLRNIWIIVISFSMLSIAAILVLLFSILTLFKLRNISMIGIIKPMAKLLLFLLGIKVKYCGEKPPTHQSVYICNHYSALDILIICSLGLQNTHYFLSVSTLKFIPIAIIGWCTKAFFIAEQTDPTKRIECFKSAEIYLKTSGNSVFLTPEGRRNSGSTVQHFNKGAFHLATVLKAPIVSLCIVTPEHCNPKLGYTFKPGEVKVLLLAIDQTRDWQLSDLDRNKNMIRQRYVNTIE